MSRTRTKPPTDRQMWRKLIARTHPDAGGDHELFIWTSELKEHVAGEEIPPPRRTTNANTDRVPFPGDEDFKTLTRRAVAFDAPETYARLLRLLQDCQEAHYGSLTKEQGRGASYKRLAAAAHKAGMSKPERVRWYRIAESIPLSDRHAGHILSRLKERS